MLFILIQGPKQAGIDIDVFLELLMEDMAKLWNEGVCLWDQYQHEYFTLYVIIFICIHDAPRGFTFSGQTKGKSGAYPICVDGTASVYHETPSLPTGGQAQPAHHSSSTPSYTHGLHPCS
jgi:hypothetical protein